MKNKKTKVLLLGLALLVFLTSGCVNQSKIKELENEIGRLNLVIQQKDVKIKTLTDQAQVKQKDLDTTKKELTDFKAELDGVKKELDTTKKELTDSKAELDGVKKELDTTKKELTDSKAELDGVKKELGTTKKELDSTKKELESTKKELESVNNKLKTLTTPPTKIKK